MIDTELRCAPAANMPPHMSALLELAGCRPINASGVLA